MLNAGNYRAKALEAALGETETGKEQVAVRFDLLDFPGQTITWYGYFTDKTTDSTFRALRTAGWSGSDLLDLSELCPGAAEVLLVVEHETYTNPQTNESKTTAKVRWVNSAGGLALKKALDPNKAKVFAEMMKARLAAFDHAAGTTKTAAKANGSQRPPAGPDSEASPFNDEKLPF